MTLHPPIAGLYNDHFRQNDRRRPNIAIGPPLCNFLWSRLERWRPKGILELGSGLSTTIIRRWNQLQGNQSVVVTIEQDPVWLEFNQRDVQRLGLDPQHFYSLEVLRAWPTIQCADFIFVDAGAGYANLANFDTYEPILLPSGRIIFQNWQETMYSNLLASFLRERGYVLEVFPDQADNWDRFFATAMKGA